MNEYLNKLQKKFPYAYSLVPRHMWVWIYDNLIIGKALNNDGRKQKPVG